MILEFLTDAPERSDGKVEVLDTGGRVGALNIPHSAMVCDLHQIVEITAELIGEQGQAIETVGFADAVSFTCLKAFVVTLYFLRSLRAPRGPLQPMPGSGRS